MSERNRDRHKTSAFCVRFTPEIHEALVAAAADKDVPVSWLVTQAVKELLRNMEPGPIKLTREAVPGD